MLRLTVISAFLILSSSQSFAQLNPIPLDITMRDGKILKGDLYSSDTTSAKPTILIMTPYGKFYYGINGLPFGVKKDISNFNYNIVVVDWRGRFASLAAFTLGSSNGEDGYDVVEWIATKNWSDGKIGTWGPSALGNVQYDMSRENPPHLVCCVPEVASPILEYEKYHPGGVIETASFKTLNEKLFPGSYDLVIANPYKNFLWTSVENNSTYPEDIKVPMLLIAGWFDHNIDQDLRLISMLREDSDVSVRGEHKILIGPWVHGGTGQASLGTTFQGDLSFPEAKKWNDSFSLMFFDYHLRGTSNNWETKPTFTYFEMGSRTWNAKNMWPEVTSEFSWYLNDDNTLTKAAPSAESQLNYMYDPNNPTPNLGGKTLSLDELQGPYDQRDSVEGRSDVLTFTTPNLEADLRVSGKIKVNLFVSSDKLDTDFWVSLNEVYPDGKSIKMLDGIQRMRFRDGYTIADTSFMESGTVYPITIELDDISNLFKKGNKIRLVVSSSSYPRYNRNMNIGGEMYPDNKSDTLVNPQIATNSIHFGGSQKSSIVLPTGITGGINQTKATIDLLAYPNPTTGMVYFKKYKNDGEIKVYNSSGLLLETYDSNPIDLSNLANGIYILETNSGDTKSISRVVKIQE